MLLALLLACAPTPMKLPTEAEVAAAPERDDDAPLYRKLYSFGFLPETQSAEQRVRLRIWLRHLDFDRYQLELLQELAARVDRERREVEARQREIVGSYEPQVAGVYQQLWTALDADASKEELAKIGDGLDIIHQREQELLELRGRSVRTVFEIEAPFLQTLTPKQETKFSDSLFLLRHRLDPYANPGDFKALVGSVYVAGEFGTLSKTTFDPDEDHLNIGGLWSEKPETLTGPFFPDARREVLLYMVLLEPTLPDAINAELAHAPSRRSGVPASPTDPSTPPPGDPSQPPPGGAAQPPPGTPTPPTPGTPEPPPPGTPTPPTPAAG